MRCPGAGHVAMWEGKTCMSSQRSVMQMLCLSPYVSLGGLKDSRTSLRRSVDFFSSCKASSKVNPCFPVYLQAQ